MKKGENERKMAGLKERLEVAKSNADINEVEDITAEIDDMTELELREQLDKRRNFELFEDEKPTAKFLKLEKAQGYSEVTRLRIPNKYFNPNLPEHNLTNYKYTTVTNQERIRLEMKIAFQQIYRKQADLRTSENDIYSFLRSDGDKKPELELEKRKLSSDKSRAMEGLLTDDGQSTYYPFSTNWQVV